RDPAGEADKKTREHPSLVDLLSKENESLRFCFFVRLHFRLKPAHSTVVTMPASAWCNSWQWNTQWPRLSARNATTYSSPGLMFSVSLITAAPVSALPFLLSTWKR